MSHWLKYTLDNVTCENNKVRPLSGSHDNTHYINNYKSHVFISAKNTFISRFLRILFDDWRDDAAAMHRGIRVRRERSLALPRVDTIPSEWRWRRRGWRWRDVCFWCGWVGVEDWPWVVPAIPFSLRSTTHATHSHHKPVVEITTFD